MILKKFIVFEGIDGAGTSTQMKIFEERLKNKGIFFTCEPTSLETGKFLRSVLRGTIELHPKTAAFLFAADRAEHMYGKGGILEHIQNGKTVISDRYLFSSLAYQSITCGKNLPHMLNSDFPLPEYVFFFDIEPEISLERIKNRDVKEIYEHLDFLKKIAQSYRAVFDEFEKSNTEMNIIRLDATQSIEKISEQITQIVPIF